MTPEDYIELESLMGKLRRVIGSRFCIVPEHIQDLTHIATYGIDGELVNQVTGLSIEDCVRRLNISPKKTNKQ
jgi:hypothetical protein